MQELTSRQRQIFEFIQQRREMEGSPPSFREIARQFRFRSVNAALDHVQALIAKGWLEHSPGRARSLRAVQISGRDDMRGRVARIPIQGGIPAGHPADGVLAGEGCVLVDIETLGIQPTARTFALRVEGDSMIGKHIAGGDLVIIEHGMEPRPGDVVAALIDGQVTLKTFVVQRGRPYLRAENSRYPNLIPQQELQIQGVMVALVRKTSSR